MNSNDGLKPSQIYSLSLIKMVCKGYNTNTIYLISSSIFHVTKTYIYLEYNIAGLSRNYLKA